MRTKLIFIVIASLTLSGCMSIAWIGYNKPVESDFVNLNANENCMKIGTQSLNDRQRKAILEASADVCKIFYSEEFKQKVISRTWLASCSLVNGKADEMSGEDVYKLLMQKIPKYSINAHKPYLAIAQTQRNESDFVYNRVAIMPSRIEAWYADELLVKSELVNTIAHETMHVISEKFLDAGHGGDCPNNKLVSYGVGNIVEILWICQHNK